MIDYSILEKKTGHKYDVISKDEKYCLVFKIDSDDEIVLTAMGANFYDPDVLQKIIDQMVSDYDPE